jgi:hypothetical protein
VGPRADHCHGLSCDSSRLQRSCMRGTAIGQCEIFFEASAVLVSALGLGTPSKLPGDRQPSPTPCGHAVKPVVKQLRIAK